MPNKLQPSQWIWFFVLSFAHMLYVTHGFYAHGQSAGGATLFNLCAWLAHSALYLLICLLPAMLLNWARRTPIAAGLAVLLSTFGILLVQADLMIYDLYNFHFNGFVWNLVTTPGGMQSLGGDEHTYVAVGFSVAITFALQLAAWWLAGKCAQKIALPLKWRYLVWLLLPLLVGEKVLYGIADVQNNAAVLDAAYTYPLYKRVTFRSVAAKLGYKALRTQHNTLKVSTGRLHYPIQPIHFSQVNALPNVVILTAESLRWDRLTPEIMPHASALAQKAWWFKNHYSSGNGTREGLFGMFYGLYGSYWDKFLHAEQSPLLMDRLQSLGYQLDLRTSAKFSYPEFNKTLFAKVPLQSLIEADDQLKPWQRDELNAKQLIDFIRKRDVNKPFFSFFFFESTHARYEFPEGAVIAKPYLKDVNYWGMSRENLKPQIGEFKNRYTNAAHWVDAQMGAVVDALEKQGLLENTIIIVTGDHGEEFLEKGFWGHNSSFVEEQTHTPFVMWVPEKWRANAQAHQEISRVTSHLDISPTLLQLLGAPADTHDYSLGTSLIAPKPRDFIVVSDWHSISVLTNQMKYRIPYITKGINHWQPTDTKDAPLEAQTAQKLMQSNQAAILQAMKNSSLFLQK